MGVNYNALPIVTGGSMDYYFVVFAERKDIDKLTVEYPDNGDQI